MMDIISAILNTDITPLLYASFQIIFLTIVGMSLGRYADKLIRNTLKSKETKVILKKIGNPNEIISIIANSVKYLIYFTFFLFILAQLGFSLIFIQFVITIIGIILLIIVILSLKDIIPNIATGIYLLKTKSINKGDKIQIDNLKGKIEDIGIINTIIKVDKTRYVVLPNYLFMRKRITKFRKK